MAEWFDLYAALRVINTILAVTALIGMGTQWRMWKDAPTEWRSVGQAAAMFACVFITASLYNLSNSAPPSPQTWLTTIGLAWLDFGIAVYAYRTRQATKNTEAPPSAGPHS